MSTVSGLEIKKNYQKMHYPGSPDFGSSAGPKAYHPEFGGIHEKGTHASTMRGKEKRAESTRTKIEAQDFNLSFATFTTRIGGATGTP